MLIGLVGKAGSGKDTAARYIVAATGGVTLALADPLKEFCQHVFGWDRERLWGPSELRNTPDPDGLTPRKALQLLGTEWGRTCRDSTWIDLGIRRALYLTTPVQVEGLGELVDRLAQPLYPVAVVTDCRFLNEARAIRAAGGKVWRIVRPGISASVGGVAGHASEAEQDSPEMDALVDVDVTNCGTLEQLRRVVELRVRQMGLRLADRCAA